MTETVPANRAGARAAWETKRAPAAFADITRAGVFEGYASIFGAMDLGGDIVERGAFRDTLQKRGAPGVRMLWQHDQAEPIGAWLSIVEDRRGLRVKGRLNLAVARAREALALMSEGVLDGLSIGFRAELATKDAATGARLLRRIDLVEISLVTFPMAPKARVTGVSVDATSVTSLARTPSVIPGSLASWRTDLHVKYLAQRARAAALRLEYEIKRATGRRLLETRYSPTQSRVPAGSGRESGR
jgi:HK97 family phage prohead protease